MIFFRNLHIRRTFSLLLLLATLFSQIQLVYACDSMADKPKHTCCCEDNQANVCPMLSNCSMNEQAKEQSCCEVSYDMLNDAGMTHSASSLDSLSSLLNAPQAPPDLVFTPVIQQALPILSWYSFSTNTHTAFARHKETYLVTRRLRL